MVFLKETLESKVGEYVSPVEHGSKRCLADTQMLGRLFTVINLAWNFRDQSFSMESLHTEGAPLREQWAAFVDRVGACGLFDAVGSVQDFDL